MKTEFKIGDRVAVYDGDKKWLGIVHSFTQDKRLAVNIEGLFLYFHPKQCRKLVKKERRRVWISPDAFEPGDNGVIWKINPGPGYIEFVEVRKK